MISSLRDEASRKKPLIGKNSTSPIWHNLIYISYLVEELILASHTKEINVNSETATHIRRDFNGQPLMKWIHDEGYLLYYFGSNDKSLWADWDLLEAMFQVID